MSPNEVCRGAADSSASLHIVAVVSANLGALVFGASRQQWSRVLTHDGVRSCVCGPGRRLLTTQGSGIFFFFCNTPVKSMTLISLLLGRINGLQKPKLETFGGIAM